MSKSLKVNISELKKKKKRMQKNIDTYRHEVNILYDNYLPQIQNKWNGDDNIVYIQNLQKHLTDLKNMVTTIETYIEVLDKAIKKYEKAQSDAKQIVS